VTISPEDAIRRYPELRTLADLRAGGWSCLPVADDGQDLVGIVGYRNTAGYTDALWVFGEGDCRAVRRHAPKLVRARLLLPDRPATGDVPGRAL